MKYLAIFAILFGLLLFSSPAFGYTASKFVSEYGEDLSEGQKIKVLVKVKGEPESKDPTKRAKEIRHLQSSVLKFCNFAGAVNVKSDSWNNEFTAVVTISLAQVLEERSDVISVQLIGASSEYAYGINYYDLNLIDLKVVDIQILSMDDTPNYSLDESDLLKVTIKVTNNGIDHFVVQDKMYKIWVLEPDFRDNNEVLEMVDNYYTSYDDELEVRYDKLNSRELFNECDYTNDRVEIGQSKVFTVCYDVLQSWANEVLNIEGEKRYYLVMMDNYKATSCPNCKKVLLSTTSYSDEKHHMPEWIQKILEWHIQGIISNEQYQTSIEYLVKKGIITEEASIEEIQLRLIEKNRHLKDHQDRLLLAQQTNLYVSSMNFYESKYTDEFSGVLCQRQNNIVTLSGDYTNDGIYYYTVFFKLILFDEFGNVVATGLSKMVDVTSKDFRNFSVSTPYRGNIDQCLVMVDSKFIPN